MSNQPCGPRLNEQVPNFNAETTIGPINFYNWAEDNWVMLFCHPADFTPICTTELGMVNKLAKEWQDRCIKPIALSVDTLESHKEWVKQIEQLEGSKLTFPIIDDSDKKISTAYGMLHPADMSKSTVRSLFIVNPAKKLRLRLDYPGAVGRNFDEVLRAIDALQVSEAKNVVTPANWKPGDAVLVPPNISTQEANKMFTEGVRQEKLEYMRFTACPKLTKAERVRSQATAGTTGTMASKQTAV